MKKKKSRNIGYLFSEGIRGIFLHGFMSFAAVCVTVACLVIIGSFSMILYNLGLKVQELESENSILVYVDENLGAQEAQNKVGSRINQIPNVRLSEFKLREDAFSDFVAKQGETEAFEGVDPQNLRDRYEVYLVDNSLMTQTVEELRQIDGVVKISCYPEVINGFETAQKVLNIASAAIILVLLVVSLLIISNTIKLVMHERRDEIAIMKMVGATNGFIRFPYVIEGFIIGIISAAVAFFAEWGLYDLLAARISAADSNLQLFSIVPFTQVLWVMVATFGVAGLFVGIFGSVMSIRKFLDV